MIGTIKEVVEWLFQQDLTKKYEVKEHKEKRSLDANAYAWVLCQKIADAVPNLTKEIVYRRAISKVGSFEVVPVKDEAVEKFKNAWQHKGLGWICDTFGDSKFRGYTNVLAYYGSSVYDTKEMSNLIDELILMANELKIETRPPEEIKALLESWNND